MSQRKHIIFSFIYEGLEQFIRAGHAPHYWLCAIKFELAARRTKGRGRCALSTGGWGGGGFCFRFLPK